VGGPRHTTERIANEIERENVMTTRANETNPKKTAAKKPKTSIDIQAVVRGINDRMAKVDNGSIETGEFVLDKVFKGSLNDALSRNPHKDKSMKAICKDSKLLVDRRVLGSCVKAAFLRRNLIAAKVDCQKLRYSHFVVLLKVTGDKKRRDLAAKANRGSWSVRDLADKIKATRQTGKNVERVMVLVKKVENPLALLKDEKTRKLLENPEELMQQLDSEDLDCIVKAIDDVVAKMASSTDFLKRAKKQIARTVKSHLKSAA
jgi:predicted DNA-binding protein YlxM (UPF0122 family)